MMRAPGVLLSVQQKKNKKKRNCLSPTPLIDWYNNKDPNIMQEKHIFLICSHFSCCILSGFNCFENVVAYYYRII